MNRILLLNSNRNFKKVLSNSGQKIFLLKIKFKMKIKTLSFKFNNLSKHL